jgi:Ca-activated chloride channel family protein
MIRPPDPLRLLPLSLLLLPLAAQNGVSSGAASQLRAALAAGLLPAPSAIAVDEILNYHRHRIAGPRPGDAVGLDVAVATLASDCGREREVLQIGLSSVPPQGAAPRGPVDLVLVIDCSGSMADGGKLATVQSALHTLVRRLGPSDRVAIVAYDDAARVELPLTPADCGHGLPDAIARLRPGGFTNLHGGLMLGLDLAAAGERAARVLLLTDGIANRGATDPAAIAADAKARHECSRGRIGITTIGVGTDVQHELLRGIARQARGQHHFLADACDVEKVFVAELQSLLGPAARELRLCVELDPDLAVAEVYGGRSHSAGRQLEFAIPDLGRDATMVLLVELRRSDSAPPGKRRFPIRARLDYVDAACGDRVQLQQVASAGAGATESCAADEIARNWRIARLAGAMREACAVHARGDVGQARWTLGAAIGDAGGAGDPAVDRVLQMAERMRERLQRAVSPCPDR